MGVPVSNLDDFQEKLARFSNRSTLFGVLLFDSRPSQQVVGRFAQEQAEWINELAHGAGIYVFYPFKKDGEKYKNPSTQIARLLGLGVGRLPGIVIFPPPIDGGRLAREQAVYIPLQNADFNDAQTYEPIMIDLFELIKEGLRNTDTSNSALVYIKDKLAILRRKKSKRGFSVHIRKGAHLVFVDMPKAVYGPFAEGFGKALGVKAAGS